MKVQSIIQYLGVEITAAALEKEVKKLWLEQGKLIKDIKNLSLYIKVEENKCYFVINEKVTGSFELSIFNKNSDAENEVAITIETEFRKGMVVRVYDGDLVGWVMGSLVRHISGDRWTIYTEQGYSLDRIVKSNYTEFKKDGCGYVLESNHCPVCGSYEIDDENPEQCCCYECDTYWNSGTGEIIREGSLC